MATSLMVVSARVLSMSGKALAFTSLSRRIDSLEELAAQLYNEAITSHHWELKVTIDDYQSTAKRTEQEEKPRTLGLASQSLTDDPIESSS